MLSALSVRAGFHGRFGGPIQLPAINQFTKLKIFTLFLRPTECTVNIALRLNTNIPLLLIQIEDGLISRLVDRVAATYLAGAAAAFRQCFDHHDLFHPIYILDTGACRAG